MKLITTLSAAALLFGGLLHAQSDLITVHFSTPVTVGETQLPAGDCDIRVMHSPSDGIVLMVHTKDGATVSVLANHVSDDSTKVTGEANVILERKGEGYRIDRILFPDHTGYEVQQ
jgi:hypothetical protein